VFSGADGSVLYRTLNSVHRDGFGLTVAGGGDADGDGFPDFAIGAQGLIGHFSTGYVNLYSGKLRARVEPVGSGCGARTFPPVLSSSPPFLASNTTVGAALAPPNSYGTFAIGLEAPEPLQLGHGCAIYVDLLRPVVFLGALTNASGTWSATVPIPNQKTMSGQRFLLQAGFYPTTSPLGFDLTQGLRWQLGL
jgi:hypothetical protein